MIWLHARERFTPWRVSVLLIGATLLALGAMALTPAGAILAAPAGQGQREETIQSRSTADEAGTNGSWRSSATGGELRGGLVVDAIADFASRDGQTVAIPAGMFGINIGIGGTFGSEQRTALRLLGEAGFARTRLDANILRVYAAREPDWSRIDPMVSDAMASGLRPVIVLAYTPAWLQPVPNPVTLQPTPNPCGTPANPGMVPPADVNQWASLAASYVRHMDAAFPGFVQDYEIWNEPDVAKFLCVADGSAATRLQSYLSIYAAAAPAMRAQAEADGASIRIGGPSLADPAALAEQWLPALLQDPRTAPHVDFVSYHHYVVDARTAVSIAWDSGSPSLLDATRDPEQGIAAVYERVSALVRQGAQPNPGATPIYLDEYNATAGASNCCRNDPAYAPVWNALFVSELLNSVYAGASAVPSQAHYFSLSYQSAHICMLGTPNPAMDCAYTSGTAPRPYPQYYAYKLLGAPGHLNLAAGGYMAASLASSYPELAITAFYTAGGDAIVIVNPTAAEYPSLTVLAKNPGLRATNGTSYLLDAGSPQIAAQPTPLREVRGGYLAALNVPAYSVVALSITGQE